MDKEKKSIDEIAEHKKIEHEKEEKEIFIKEGEEQKDEEEQDLKEVKKEEKNQRLKHKLNPKVPNKLLITLLIVFLLVLGFIAWGIFNLGWWDLGSNPQITKKDEEKSGPKITCPLNGIQTSEERSELRPYAVMIENHPDARPQSGLSRADIIYEAVAEGGITRFLAVFGCQDYSDEIGPVRSARDYYIYWSEDFGAFYVHAGGSPESLSLIQKNDVPAIDYGKFAKSFWRSARRPAPHNVYTTLERLNSAAKKLGVSLNYNYEELKINENPQIDGAPEAYKITIPFSSTLYNVDWQYVEKDSNYLRDLGGKPHKDKITGEQLKTISVVVIFTTITPDNSEPAKKRVNIQTKGEGEAWIFQKGKKIIGKWKKETTSSRTLFYDEEGEQIEFMPGQQWIEVVQAGTVVTYK